MIIKIILAVIFLVGLLYIVAPEPQSISYFPPLPNSLKSNQAGDTWQNPNNEAFYSDNRRSVATSYYKNIFDSLEIFGIKIPSLRLNHPPEEAFEYIRDQQTSTYLEEYYYPLRNSLFVNGYEPIDDNGNLRPKLTDSTIVNGRFYQSKVTLRYYSNSLKNRLIVYLGIWLAGFGLLYFGKKILFEKE